MNEELKYPIKYAVMPCFDYYYTIRKRIVRDFGVVATIVSKCYVVSEKMIYNSDGTFRLQYQVAFTHNIDNSKGDDIVLEVPRCTRLDSVSKITTVSQVFDTFDEAFLSSEKTNDEILCERIKRLWFNKYYEDNIRLIELEHKEVIDKYKKLEDIIGQENSDMIITKRKSLVLKI